MKAVIGGVERTVHYFVLDLSQSDGCFIKALPAETVETLCDGHFLAFSFRGGTPLSVEYDNTKLAVAKVLVDGRRRRTRVFSELVSHYMYEDRSAVQAAVSLCTRLVLGRWAGPPSDHG